MNYWDNDYLYSKHKAWTTTPNPNWVYATPEELDMFLNDLKARFWTWNDALVYELHDNLSLPPL